MQNGIRRVVPLGERNASPLALIPTQVFREGLVPIAQEKRTRSFFFLMLFQALRENYFSRGEKGDY